MADTKYRFRPTWGANPVEEQEKQAAAEVKAKAVRAGAIIPRFFMFAKFKDAPEEVWGWETFLGAGSDINVMMQNLEKLPHGAGWQIVDIFSLSVIAGSDELPESIAGRH